MPQIDVSQQLYDFLIDQPAKGHEGDINDYLFSHFLPHSPKEDNRDEKIRDFLKLESFKQLQTPRKYLRIFEALHQIDPTRFATLNNFHPPHWKRIIFSNNRSAISRSTTSNSIEPIPNSTFYALTGLLAKEYQDCAFHAARHLAYPYPVALEIRKSLEEEVRPYLEAL